jgi:hypothetical protein
MRIMILAVLLAALAAAPARAEVEPFPGQTWVVPSEGFVWSASSWPAALPSQMLDFTVYLDEYEELPADLDVEVATGPELDAEGTLADADVIERYEAQPVAGHPTVFAARTRPEAQWLSQPATYYWQATYEEYEDGEEELYASAVHTLSIVPAPRPDPPQTFTFTPPPAPAAPAAAVITPPPLAATTAREIVRRAILAGTHRDYRGLTYRCTTAPAAATCRPSWRDHRFRYRGTLRISTGTAGITAAFTGTRAARACQRHCVRKYAWTTRL